MTKELQSTFHLKTNKCSYSFMKPSRLITRKEQSGILIFLSPLTQCIEMTSVSKVPRFKAIALGIELSYPKQQMPTYAIFYAKSTRDSYSSWTTFFEDYVYMFNCKLPLRHFTSFLPRGVHSGWGIVVSLLVRTSVPKIFDFK